MRSNPNLQRQSPLTPRARIALAPTSEQVMSALPLEQLSPPEAHVDAAHIPAGHAFLQWLLERRGWIVLCLLLDFALASVGVLLASHGLGNTLHVSRGGFAGFTLPPLVLALLFRVGGYKKRPRVLVLDGIVPVLRAVTAATITVAALGVLLDHGRVADRWLALRAWLFTVILVCIGRAVLAVIHRWARVNRLVVEPVIIVGAGLVGSRLARRLEDHPEYGLFPVAFLDDDAMSSAHAGRRSAPVMGTIDAIDDVVAHTGVRHVIVAFSKAADARVSALIHRCHEHGVEVSVVPRLFDAINDRIVYGALGGLPMLRLSRVNPRGWQFVVKHALDRILAAVLLLLLAPLLACVALAVRLTSRGPILFRQRRVGRDGKAFDLYKFRSMQWQPADQSGDDGRMALLVEHDMGPGGLEGNKRLTPIGAFLRQLSLDELPQFFNVLRGDMSIVGPRPERPEFVQLFGRDIWRYDDRHRVKSGITGWAQVHGLRGPTSIVDRIEWDNYYIDHWSLLLDLKILVLTAVALFTGE